MWIRNSSYSLILMVYSDTVFVQARRLYHISCCMIWNVNQVWTSVHLIVCGNTVRSTEAIDLRDPSKSGWICRHCYVVQKRGDCYSAGIRIWCHIIISWFLCIHCVSRVWIPESVCVTINFEEYLFRKFLKTRHKNWRGGTYYTRVE